MIELLIEHAVELSLSALILALAVVVFLALFGCLAVLFVPGVW
jgi:hypothetical protein